MKTDTLTREVWTIKADAFPTDGSIEEQARFLLRYAILAPSSHNSQPWEFTIDGDSIEIYPAEARWLEVADENKRELYLSLGCAIENLTIAAEHFDLGYQIEFFDDADHVSVITLDPENEPSSERPTGLFDEITERTTNHHLFEDRPLPDALCERLGARVIENDVGLLLIDDPAQQASIAELQAEADRKLMENPDYRKELGYWIGTGALGDSWLAARIGQLVVSYLDIGDREAKKNSKLLQSAPVIGVLVTDSNDKASLIKAGRVFERLALAATTEGVAVHPMSQILERSEMHEDLTSLLEGNDLQPQHLFRLGYAEDEQEHTPRWPLGKFLVE